MWLLSLPKARLTLSNYHLPPLPAWHHVESSSGVCQPHPVSSAASTSCLQEDPASTTFFHFLCCSLCFRVADYSRPVAITDCCCCPSPYWPHKIVSPVICPLLHFTCNIFFLNTFLDQSVELVGEGFVSGGAYPVYLLPQYVFDIFSSRLCL